MLSYDEILHLIDELEDGELEKRCSPADLERINQFFVHLAKQGSNLEEEHSLEEDIEALFEHEHPHYEFAFDQGNDYIIVPAIFYGHGEIILCRSWLSKQWKQTKKFVSKHKTAIIIGAAIVAASVVVVCLAIAASTALATVAVEAANAIATEPSLQEEMGQEPLLQEVMEEHITSFKEELAEANLVPTDPTFGEKVRRFGSRLAHETFEEVSELAVIIPACLEGIKNLGELVVGEGEFPFNDFVFPSSSPMENYEQSVAAGHQIIDEVFSTDQACHYTPEAKTHDIRNEFTYAILPPPGAFRALLTESEAALSRSKFAQVENILAKHNRRYLTEAEARTLIHQCDIPTFPRPYGIPENFKIRISDQGGGMIYVHPENNHISVRVMPGKPHSEYPHQRTPYVIYKKHGQTLDKFGKRADPNTPEAHIPLEDFIYEK